MNLQQALEKTVERIQSTTKEDMKEKLSKVEKKAFVSTLNQLWEFNLSSSESDEFSVIEETILVSHVCGKRYRATDSLKVILKTIDNSVTNTTSNSKKYLLAA